MAAAAKGAAAEGWGEAAGGREGRFGFGVEAVELARAVAASGATEEADAALAAARPAVVAAGSGRG